MFQPTDVERAASAYPERFRPPPRAWRDDVPPGFYVKLYYERDNAPAHLTGLVGELVVVRVVQREEVNGRRLYLGVVAADPVTPEFPKLGHRVTFEPCNVASIHTPQEVWGGVPDDAARR